MPLCRQSGKSFEVNSADLQMLDLLSPVLGGKKYSLAMPSLCPEMRFQRRAAHRNERNLYRRNCAKTGKPVITIFSEDKTFPVYAHDVWWGDGWDPKDYGREFDFSRPFFEQFVELRAAVPRLPLLAKDSINSDYTNHAANNKDCYLTTIVFGSEDIHYSRKVFRGRSIVDCTYVMPKSGELLYECYWANNLYDCMFAVFCAHSSCLRFCLDCRGCNNCFMSNGLRNRSFVFRNEQLSQAEYQARMAKLSTGSYAALQQYREEFRQLWLKSPHPALRLESCEDVAGDLLIECKDCFDCFLSVGGENCRHCVEFDSSLGNLRAINCMDCFGFGNGELLYEVQGQAGGYRNVGCNWSYDVSNSLYLDMCFNVSDCFGCVGLHGHEKFCLFNRQYSQAEYEALVGRVVEHMRNTGEWGEFFPASTSIFGYNETLAMEYFPLSREEALKCGFKWSDYQVPIPRTARSIAAADLPDNIADVDDSVLDASIVCGRSNRPFRITRRELEFYRQQGLPLPRLHYDERYLDRLWYRNPPRLFKRRSAISGTEIVSSFAPERSEIVISNEEYLQQLY